MRKCRFLMSLRIISTVRPSTKISRLLLILDYVLGIQRDPLAEEAWLSLIHRVYFKGHDLFEDIDMGLAH